MCVCDVKNYIKDIHNDIQKFYFLYVYCSFQLSFTEKSYKI